MTCFLSQEFLGKKQKQRKGETGKKVEEERKEKHKERGREGGKWRRNTKREVV